MTWDYPAYMTTVHGNWLTAIDALITASTFPTLTPYNPATLIAGMLTNIGQLQTIVTALDEHADYDTIYANAINLIDTTFVPEAYIVARIAAHTTDLDTEINTKIYPRFLSGMRNINAVLSSAFVIGQAAIAQDKLDKVAKFSADMRLQVLNKRSDMVTAVAGEMLRIKLQKMEFNRVIVSLELDYARLALAANSDYTNDLKSNAIDLMKWPLEKYKYGANLLAGLTGGVSGTSAMEGSRTARMIGSGLSGAAAGAMIGGATIGGGGGEGIGAILGGIAGMIGGS